LKYQGLEGTRPYRGAAWYYAEYRPKISREFIALATSHLGWRADDRILDLGTGPGQIALRLAPYVREVVGIDIEADMIAEAQTRAAAKGTKNVSFLNAGSDDLPRLKSTLGVFRAVTMGETFHWMLDRDRILRDLAGVTTDDGAVLFIRTGQLVREDERLGGARKVVRELLARRLEDVPPGPHPGGRHDPYPEILARSPFHVVESIECEYEAMTAPDIDALIGREYTGSHVLTPLGGRRAGFEMDARRELQDTLRRP